jgi:hypothetical protein
MFTQEHYDLICELCFTETIGKVIFSDKATYEVVFTGAIIDYSVHNSFIKSIALLERIQIENKTIEELHALISKHRLPTYDFVNLILLKGQGFFYYITETYLAVIVINLDEYVGILNRGNDG